MRTRTPAPLGPGSTLGEYHIFRPLARGGMAELFLARAEHVPGVHQVVVIKRILPELALNDDVVKMFLDEARLVATLQHPNIVQITDVAEVDGSYFMAMEYLHGEDLYSLQRACVERGERLPLELALQIAIAVCAGLHYAHEHVGYDGKPQHIVHRDVSPQNVFITYEGGVKLLDFGVAKAAGRLHNTSRMGAIKGKLSYLSPEQCRGEPVDRRSDIFSLGILLYEMTLGRKLFGGRSDFNVLKQIAEQPITPPREIDPEYPAGLERIVLRALERDPERRYPTARAMQYDIEMLAEEMGLFLSPSRLARHLERLFGAKIEAWREARAQGRSLADYLERTLSQFTVLSEKPVEVADAEEAMTIRGDTLPQAPVVARGAAAVAAAGASTTRPTANLRRAAAVPEPVDDDAPTTTDRVAAAKPEELNSLIPSPLGPHVIGSLAAALVVLLSVWALALAGYQPLP